MRTEFPRGGYNHMSGIVQHFGTAVQRTCGRDPLAARRLLRLGYHAKSMQLKVMPGALHKAAQMAAVETTAAMVAPLDHPDQSVMVSLFTPCEMLQVLGLHPYSCEGLGCFLSGAWAEKRFLEHAESEGLPETFCSYHKAFIGAAEMGLMPKPRFIINTTLACDANLLTFRRMAEFYQVPQLVLEIPYEQDAEAVRYVADQLREMRGFLEEHTGQKIDEDALRERVARSQRSMDNFQQYMTLRADKQILGDLTGEMFSAMMLHILLGTEAAEQYTQQCVRMAESASPASSGVRLVWMHTNPFWVKPLREMVDFHARVQVVGCDMCFEGLIQTDENDPYVAMAQRLVHSAFNGPVTRRIDRGIEAARQLNADGVVWFCHWGCKHTLGGAQLAKKRFEEAGIPCLILDGDGCDRSHGGEGQLMTRMEAFVEMLEREKEAKS